MFVEVHIPDHSPDHRGFSYFVPEFLRSQIVRGCVVEVPLKDELVPAVVTLLGVEAPERGEAKAIASVLLHERVLAEYQIDAAYALAEKYFVFFHAVVSFFLPPAVLRRHLKTLKGYSSLPLPVRSDGEKSSIWSASANAPLSEPTKENPRTPTVVYDRNGLGPEGLFGTRFPLEPGTALILPSDAAVRRFLAKTTFSQDDFFVHRSDMPEAFDFKFRLAVALREKPFLVWSRRLCSYNLSAYPNVWFFEDAVASEIRHRFFHSYDLRFLLTEFARSGNFRIRVSSHVPSIWAMAQTLGSHWPLENVA